MSRANEGLQVIWVPLSAWMHKHTDIELYQAAHDPERPLESLVEGHLDLADASASDESFSLIPWREQLRPVLAS